MSLRLVITDIDGTLLDDAGNLPAANRDALKACRDRGVLTCLATGRRWTTCTRVLDRLELRPLVDYCILNNGMIVHDVGAARTLWHREFPLAQVLAAVEALNRHGLDPIALGHNPDLKTRDVFYRRDSLMNADFIDKNPDHCVRLDDWSELRGKHVVELAMIGPERALRAAADGLAGLDLEVAIIRNTYYKEYMLELTPRGMSKLTGARELLAHLGLSDHEALAIGDSENDYTLIKHLPFSAAVGNADPKLKAAARETTGTNAEGGFAQAVMKRLGAGG